MNKCHFLLFFLVSAFLLNGCATNKIPNFDNRSNLGNADKYLAFVGKKVQIEKYNPYEEVEYKSEDEIILYHFIPFRVRYEILELVHGEYANKTVDFEVFESFGFPQFAKNDIAMIYLEEVDGRLQHIGSGLHEVYSTNDERYAFCGNPYLSFEGFSETEKKHLTNITFSPPVIKKISDYLKFETYDDYDETKKKILREKIRAYFNEDDFEIEGDLARSKRGVYSDELFKIEYKVNLLPALRGYICEDKFDSSTDRYEFDDEVNSCIADLEERNLPNFN